MFAAWEVGVWKALGPHIRPDMVVGASAGAWNAWAIAGGATVDDLARDWMDPRTSAIMQPGLHTAGILRPDGLHAKARELFERYQPHMPIGITLVEVPSMRLRLIRDRDITWQHLAATCAIPLCFPPVSIDGRRYVDGGLRGALPLWAAREMGAHRFIALNCLTTLPFRLLRLGLGLISPRVETSGVTLIEPSAGLGSVRDSVVWCAANVARWIEQGEADGNRALSSVRM
jgi:predicted acylesterase/phospholipase RssA